MYAQIDTIGHMGPELPAFGSADYCIPTPNIIKHLVVASKVTVVNMVQDRVMVVMVAW